MDFSILDELQPIAEELQRHMSPHVLEHLARGTETILGMRGHSGKIFKKSQIIK